MNSLKERWSEATIEPSKPSPFGMTVDGYQDYRGAPVESLRQIQEWYVERCDFSSSAFRRLRMEKCYFKSCIFDGANLSELFVRSCEFIDCRFRKSDLRLAQIGVAGSSFIRCDVEHVQIAKAGFHNAIFQEMLFNGRDWEGVDFRASGFWNCAFQGNVRDVMFRGDYQYPTEKEINGPPRGSGLHHVSFLDAELFWVGFTNGCPLEDITLPSSGSAFVCDVGSLLDYEKKLESLYSSDLCHGMAKYFRIVRVHAPLQPLRILSRNDLLHFLDPENCSEIFDLLKRELALNP